MSIKDSTVQVALDMLEGKRTAAQITVLNTLKSDEFLQNLVQGGHSMQVLLSEPMVSEDVDYRNSNTMCDLMCITCELGAQISGYGSFSWYTEPGDVATIGASTDVNVPTCKYILMKGVLE